MEEPTLTFIWLAVLRKHTICLEFWPLQTTGSLKSKNHVKETTLNCWVFLGNCQFFGKPGTGGSFDSENINEFKLEVLRFWKFLGKPDTEVLNKILITTTEKATKVFDVWALHSNSHIRCQQSSEGVCYFPMVPLQAKWVFTLTW